MTCKEKLRELYPDYESLLDHVIYINCPEDYMDIESPEYCDPCTDVCESCWVREMYMAGEALETRPTIKDSGDRTEFSTGAVRDMREGKGRCDLMPLRVMAKCYSLFADGDEDDESIVRVFNYIADFQDTNDTMYLVKALDYFQGYKGWSEMFLEVAKHFEEGAKKYGENNWQKGIPVKCYIDSAVRHYLKWLRGDKDEPHDRAFVWNLMCCIWEVDYGEECRKSKEDQS